MRHELRVLGDADELAAAAAQHVAARAAEVGDGGFHLAVSGGKTPWVMLARLAELAMPWDRTVIWQVDERVLPAGDPGRNLTHLHESLGAHAARVRPMPVEDADLASAAARYAAELPQRFDLVHLGLGPDGHTASLVPGDPVLEVDDRLVAVTAAPYQGSRRMTLTYPALQRAEELLWLVGGQEKRRALSALLSGDASIPAGRVRARRSLVMADQAAA